MMDTSKIRLRELKETDRELYLLAASEEPGCEKLYSDNLCANITWSLAYGDKGKRKYQIHDFYPKGSRADWKEIPGCRSHKYGRK